MRVPTLRTIALTLALATTFGACEDRDPSHDTPPPPEAARAVGPIARDASRDRPVRRLSNAEISASLALLLNARVTPRERLERRDYLTREHQVSLSSYALIKPAGTSA